MTEKETTKPSLFRSLNFALLLIFVTAIAVRIVFLIQYRKDPFFESPLFDAEFYRNWAGSIAGGNWLGDRVFFVSPLYAYVLAFLEMIFGYDIFRVIFAQFILGAVNCVLIYLIGRRLFGEVVGALAGLMASFYGFFIFTEAQLLKNSIAYSLVALSYLLFLMAREKGKSYLWACLGITAGLCALAIPNILAVIPLLYGFIVFQDKDRRSSLRKLAALSLGLILTVAPVSIRNYAVGRDFVLISSNGGINLFLGTDPVTDGGLHPSRLIQQAPELEESSSTFLAQRSLQKSLRPSEVSAFWSSMALRNLTRKPFETLHLFFRKLGRFWNWRELTDNLDFYYFREKYPILEVPFMNFGSMAPLALLGLWLARKEKEKVLPAFLFISIFTASSLPFVIFGRYRTPVVPVLIIFAAYALYTCGQKAYRKAWKEVVICAVILLPAVAIINSGDRTHDFSSTQRAKGEIYLKRGLPEMAVSEFAEAVKSNPYDYYSHNALGQAYLDTGRYDEAISSFEKAVSLFPGFLDAHYSLALAYAVTGDRQSALDEQKKVEMLDAGGQRSLMLKQLLMSMNKQI